MAVAALADVMGVELNDEIRLPAPVASPLEDMTINKLVEEIENMPTTELFPVWKREMINKIPRWLASQFHYGRWAEEEDLNDLEKILGVRPTDNDEGDKALCDFIVVAGPEHDESWCGFSIAAPCVSAISAWVPTRRQTILSLPGRKR